jgi:Flp pilus assembly protein TadD
VELEARRELAARNWVSADRALRAWLAAEPENGQAHYEHAGVLYQMKRYDEAAAQYEKTVALRAMVPLANYNAACCYALVGKKDKALELLERAVETGAFSDRTSIKNDPDFVSLASDARFTKLVGGAE